MKRLIVFCLLLTACASPVAAVEWNAELSIKSGYSWRGLQINDGAVLQPAVSAASGGWWIEVWGNMDLTDANNDRYRMNEVDITLAHDWEFDGWNFSAGAVWYTYPGSDDPSTTELFAGIMLHTFLQPALTIYRDIDAYDGTYIELSVSHAFSLGSDRFPEGLILTAMTGYGTTDFKEGYFMYGRPSSAQPVPVRPAPPHDILPQMDRPSSGLVDYACEMDLPIQFDKGLLSFRVMYINLADSEIHSPNAAFDDGHLVYGITYSLDF